MVKDFYCSRRTDWAIVRDFGCGFTASVWNAAQLRIVLSTSTKEYLNDVTTQTAGDIKDTIQHKMTELELLSDSVSRFDSVKDGGSLREYLDSKARTQEFDPLAVFDRNGNSVFSESEVFADKREQKALLQMDSVQSSFEGKSVPVIWVGKPSFTRFRSMRMIR